MEIRAKFNEIFMENFFQFNRTSKDWYNFHLIFSNDISCYFVSMKIINFEIAKFF